MARGMEVIRAPNESLLNFSSLRRMHRGLCLTAIQPGQAESKYGLTQTSNGNCVGSHFLAVISWQGSAK